MSTWAPNVSKIMDYGYGSSRGGLAVVGAITHHVAGTDGRDYVARSNSRDSHPTYHIADDGTVTGIVHPDRKPSSTGGSIDKSCVTVEIDNTRVGGDWVVSQAALDAWAVIIRHHADESPRRGRAIEKNIPSQAQAGFFVGWHSQYVQTACPGPFVISHLGGVIAKANGSSVPTNNGSSSVPASQPVASGRTWSYMEPPQGGTVAKDVQRYLAARGRYNYPDGSARPIDGIWGKFTRMGIQITLDVSGRFKGIIDGIIEGGGCWGIQQYAHDFGDYPAQYIDGHLGINSWIGFALGLKRP